jgi:hypothetical protein
MPTWSELSGFGLSSSSQLTEQLGDGVNSDVRTHFADSFCNSNYAE